MRLRHRNCIALVLLALMMIACSPTVNHRGRLPDDINTSEIKPKLHNKEDVLRLIGSPSTVAAFDPNTWYYFTNTTETISFFNPKTVEQKLISIKFDQNGIVQHIGEIDPSDTREVVYVERITPTSGQSASFLQQLFGNFGRMSRKDPVSN